MSDTVTLDELTTRTGMEVLDHLARDVEIPIVDGLQAQGDLIIIPAAELDDPVLLATQPAAGALPDATWTDVLASGIELLRGAAGGNPHTLVADPGTCRWTTDVHDSEGLALGVLENTAPAYLIHPEHGGTGIAPGRHVVRRQREMAAEQRLVAD